MTKLGENKYASEAEAEDEIEITPAMIEAGISELSRYNPDYESKDEAVARIYEAMFRFSPYRAVSNLEN
jgi:hypothetical protein